jgi:hypothetical protein
MKLLFLSCALSISCVAMAQTTQKIKATPVETAANAKPSAASVSFNAKTSEFSTDMKHNNLAKAQSSFQLIVKMMQGHMEETKALSSSASTDQEKQAAMVSLRKQQIAYTEIVKLSKDLKANHQAITEKLQTFSNTY